MPDSNTAQDADAGRLVCSRCGACKTALLEPPLPGRRGQLVQAQVCADCWQAWVEEQTRLINHERLQPAEPADRQRLYALMAEFLRLGEQGAGSGQGPG
jgi:Fe-S cluster biosynthesis and repair protein YggX